MSEIIERAKEYSEQWKKKKKRGKIVLRGAVPGVRSHREHK